VFLTLADAQTMTVEQAKSILITTKPIPSPTVAFGFTDPVARSAAEQLYDRQIRAITTLAEANIPDVTKLLIPFLNYPRKGFEYPVPDPQPVATGTNVYKSQRKDWPVFSAIVAVPGAGQSLLDYVRDKGNPDEYRIAAFQVLRAVDIGKFRTVAKELDAEFAGAGPESAEYLNEIKAGSSFCGVRSFTRAQ
jgi:hypothetical protein